MTQGQPTGDSGRSLQELHERNRFLVLQQVHSRCGTDPRAEVVGRDLARHLQLPLEEVFRILEFLARNQYIHYLGAGPRVRLAPRGLEYLTGGRGQRETVREARAPSPAP